MNPLRIQFFTHYCHPAGTYFRFHNLAIGLARLGHDVTVFAADANPRSRARTEMRDGVRYGIVPEWRGARIFGQGCHPGSALRRATAEYPVADVAHVFAPFPSAAAAWRTASRGASVCCFDWDDLWVGGLLADAPHGLAAAWTRFAVGSLERCLPARADHVTACSAFLADLARVRGALGTTVVPNGFWPTAAADRRAARARLGLDAEAPIMGFMGFTIGEAVWCLEGFAAVAARDPRVRLALCGRTLPGLDALPPAVRARVTHLGSLPPVDIPAFVAAIDLGLLPMADTPFNRSRFPIKFAEYLGGGTPVLLSDVGECAHLARRLPGAVLAGTELGGWREACVAAAGALLAEALPVVDRSVVAGILGWNVMAAQVESLYLALLRGHASGRPPPQAGRALS